MEYERKFSELLFALCERYTPAQVFILVDCRVPEMELRPVLRENILKMEIDENQKDINSVATVWAFLISRKATRHAVLVNIGGGVICDVGGFAASTYKRGIDYVNVPSTLLAMIDAGIGGKTGVNFEGVKNVVGVICQPVEIMIIPELLESLSKEELLAGYAEMIKTALLKDKDFLNTVTDSMDELRAVESLMPLIEEAKSFKDSIVAMDPYDHNERKQLNFGHTVGHALEEVSAASGKPIRHGYAVMYGMVAETYLSVIKLGLDRDVLRKLTHWMTIYYGHVDCPCKDYPKLMEMMTHDKKNEQGDAPVFVLLRAIGEPIIDQKVSETEVKEALDYLFSL